MSVCIVVANNEHPDSCGPQGQPWALWGAKRQVKVAGTAEAVKKAGLPLTSVPPIQMVSKSTQLHSNRPSLDLL